jgi:hypothetical protein
MKYILLTGIAVGLLLGTFLVQAAKKQIDSTSTTDRYRQAYVESCTQSGKTPKSFCDCTFTELSRNHSVAQITDLGLEAKATNKIPAPMMDAMLMCSNKL